MIDSRSLAIDWDGVLRRRGRAMPEALVVLKTMPRV